MQFGHVYGYFNLLAGLYFKVGGQSSDDGDVANGKVHNYFRSQGLDNFDIG